MGDFKIIAFDEDKKEYFMEVFGKTTVEIQGFIGFKANTPDGIKHLHRIHKDELTPEVKARYHKLVARKFNVPIEEVEKTLAETDYVIDERGCTIHVDNPQRWI